METFIKQTPSPNFSDRTMDAIGFCIHGTTGSYESAINWLCTPPEKRPVMSYSSAHYVIAKDGRCTQLVSESKESWHAGNISNPTERAKKLLPIKNGKYLNPNKTLIGIELEWFIGGFITESQYKVIIDIIKKSNIKNPVILCHKEITDYKSDFPNSEEVVANITRRLNLLNAIQPTPTPDKISTLLAQLNTQIANKNYKGARDTTSFLFNELSKLK
jgi:hypothetical protein